MKEINITIHFETQKVEEENIDHLTEDEKYLYNKLIKQVAKYERKIVNLEWELYTLTNK